MRYLLVVGKFGVSYITEMGVLVNRFCVIPYSHHAYDMYRHRWSIMYFLVVIPTHEIFSCQIDRLAEAWQVDGLIIATRPTAWHIATSLQI